MLRWSATTWRKLEAVRDRIFHSAGTGERYVLETMEKEIGMAAVSAHWRVPLRIDEVAQMAPTADVRLRRGRP